MFYWSIREGFAVVGWAIRYSSKFLTHQNSSLALTLYSNLVSHPHKSFSFPLAKQIWKAKIRKKIKTFGWLVAKGKLNMMGNLQLRRHYNAFNPHWCILCSENEEDNDHLFRYCKIARELWQMFFMIWSEEWVATRRIGNFLWTIMVWDKIVILKAVGNFFFYHSMVYIVRKE